MRNMTYRDALRQAVREEMHRDPDVFMMGEDIGVYGNVFRLFDGLIDEFGPQRIIDTPLAELGIVGLAVGAAMEGGRPIAEIMYVDFITLGMEPLINQAAKLSYISNGQLSCPLVLRTQGGIGRSKGCHHSQSFESWFAHTPGLQVAMPSDPYDVKGMLKTAVRSNNPVVFLEHKQLYNTLGPVPEEEYLVPFGQASVKRAGEDVTIIATTYQVVQALRVAEQLAGEGISCEVVDPRTLYPLDRETLVASVQKTNRAVVVQGAPEMYGTAAEFITLLQQEAFDYLDAPVQRVAAAHLVVPMAPSLEDEVAVKDEDIAAAVRSLF